MRSAENSYDHILIGAGAAGLHILLQIMARPSLSEKRILVLEPSKKDENDRTWCFWEKGEGQWDHLLTGRWAEGHFHGPTHSIPLSLNGYEYKMLRGLDFYRYAMEQIENAKNITIHHEKVSEVRRKGEWIQVQTDKGLYYSPSLFDSRIPKAFEKKNDGHQRLLQHFKGKLIRTEERTFDPSTFTMMDFRASWNGSTSFCYVLPTSAREALVEYTLFTDTLLSSEEYEKLVNKEIEGRLKISSYETLEEEFGVIPMSDFPFEKEQELGQLLIGTAGGWVRPSSGYSFKNAERYSKLVVDALVSGEPLPTHPFKARHRFYDRILLNILLEENELGPLIFEQLYHRNPTDRILRFLDEQSSLKEDLQLMLSLDSAPFLRALRRLYL
jgi:lycopene beta-cyclase